MAFQATLRFEDGAERRLELAPGQTVLDAALAAGIRLAHQCRSGSCASCICTVEAGATHALAGRAQALLKSELAAGMRLSCSLFADSDISLRFPYSSQLTAGALPQTIAARLAALQKLSADVWQLLLELDEPLDFLPGQYLRLQVPGTAHWRSYSIASLPDSPRRIALVVKAHPTGVMSDYLATRAAAGDVCRVEGPFGAFVLAKHAGPHVFIAGGTGLGPILPLIDQLRERPGRTPDALLAFACSRAGSLFHQDEIELRRCWMGRLRTRIGVSRPEADWNGPVGNPLALVEDADLRSDSIVYVCGAPGLIEATRERCLALGIPPERIRAEQYLPEIAGA